MSKVWWISLAALFVFACSDDETTENNANNSNNSNNASNNANNSNNATNNSNNATNNSNNATNNSNNATNNSNNATNNSNNATNNTNNNAITSCTSEGLTSCFVNDDCEATERCEDITDGMDVACCVTGDRGTGVLGDACTNENDCASGLCVQRNDEPFICTQVCSETTVCPTNYECHPVLAMCFPTAI